jgi:DNA-binding LytR/AlgR family response regulator
MFKLKVKNKHRSYIIKQLHVAETDKYEYVLTDDRALIEPDKINIVFDVNHINKVSRLLDWIVKGEDIYISGYNEFGQKVVEARNVVYFEAMQNEVYAVLAKTRLFVQKKLYELEQELNAKGFVRISKHCIVNISQINYIKPLMNAKLELLMNNNDICEVNRSYRKQFKEALKE